MKRKYLRLFWPLYPLVVLFNAMYFTYDVRHHTGFEGLDIGLCIIGLGIVAGIHYATARHLRNRP